MSPYSRRRSGIDDALYLGISGRDQQVDSAIDVGAIAAERVEHRFGDRRNRRLMKHVVDALAGLVHGIGVEDIGLAEVDTVQNAIQVFALAGSEVVDAADLLSAIK